MPVPRAKYVDEALNSVSLGHVLHIPANRLSCKVLFIEKGNGLKVGRGVRSMDLWECAKPQMTDLLLKMV